MAPLINSNPTVCSKSRAGKEPRKHQSSSYLLAFCWKGIQQFTLCLGEWYQLTVDSPHIWPVMRKVFHVTPSDFLLFMGFIRSSLWHKRHGVSNHRQLYDLFNSLFKPTTKNTSKLSIISLCVCVCPVMEKAWSMPWRHYICQFIQLEVFLLHRRCHREKQKLILTTVTSFSLSTQEKTQSGISVK